MQSSEPNTVDFYDDKDYESFVFFGSLRHSVESLDEELGNELLRAVMIYGTERVIKSSNPVIISILHSVVPNIDKAHVRHEESKKRLQEYRMEKEADRSRGYKKGRY